jgi:Fe-S-cluster-containing hydrogenase component 2/CRP-like cAMP-binding protein
MTPAAREVVDEAFLVHTFQSSVFANLEHDLLKNLAARARLRVFHRGDVIVREGEEGSRFFFIRSGMVKVFKQQSGRDIVLAYLSAGQYFGEMAVLSGKPRIASAGAIDRVEVIELSREDFLECVESHPGLRKRFDEESDRRHLRNIELEVRPELAELGRFMIREEVVVGDNVLLIDENRCIQCDQCVNACESVHADGQSRIKRTGIKFANVLVANSCRHCENPLCMTDCPPGDAIVRDPHGEVYIRDNCIGCGRCAANCPYDNIFMVNPEPEHSVWNWLKRSLRLAPEPPEPASSFPVKCDLCRDVPSGPACVRSCPTGAVLRLTPAEYNRTIEALALERKESL